MIAEVLIAQARDAANRQDWSQAAALATELRWQFPDTAAGYQIGGVAARTLRRFTESRDILTSAEGRFPGDAWPLMELVWTAKAAGDRREEIRLIGVLLARFPDRPAAYQLGFILALEMQRFVEAAHFVAEAQTRFPDQAWPLVNAALLAQESGDTQTVVSITAGLRRNYPDEPTGYEAGAAAARTMRRFDEAADLLNEAMARFPRRTAPLVEAAYNETARGNFEAALGHAARLREKFPADAAGYQIGSRFLRQWGRFDEADAIIEQARRSLPGQAWPEEDAQAARRARENRADAGQLLAALAGGTEGFFTAAMRAPPGKRVVVILGMHRAGTSLCAQIVQKLGVTLGGPLAKPSFDNPDGFFEHTGIADCHETLLAAQGDRWDTVRLVRRTPEDFWQSDAVAGVRAKLRRIVEAQITEAGGVWAFKDPRTVSFLPLWQQLFTELGVRPVWLLAVRDPGAVADSLRARDGLPAGLAGLLWAEHYLAALRHLGPRIAGIVHYERWFSTPLEQIGAVAALLGGATAADVDAARGAIKAGLRHAEPADETLDLARRVHGWLRADHADLARLQVAANTVWSELEFLARAKL
jgi:tetratricopeptide (TPR) repeat protein